MLLFRSDPRSPMSMKHLVATLGPPHGKPWWWTYASLDRGACTVDYARLIYRGRYSQDIGTLELPVVMLKVLWNLLGWRARRYSHVFTFECDLVGLSIAFWQSLTGMRRPRHTILQFIMREKVATTGSRAKHALMRFLFRSVHRVVVSSTSEAEYYREAFGWSVTKARFVPLHTNPQLLDRAPVEEEDYYIAAGRSFRDFDTLLRAVTGTGLKLVIVGGRGTCDKFAGLDNVVAMENIPAPELEALVQRARAVVVPLQDRRISIGQSVVLQAMALGKAIVATRTAGTLDYIRHMEDGILVSPGREDELRAALLRLENAQLRQALGARARSRVAAAHLPQHYAASVCRAISA